MRIDTLDRRRFLRGSAAALALPAFESFGVLASAAATDPRRDRPKRLVCAYQPDGVPMPLPQDPAHEDWSWFPHGNGRDYRLTRCLEPLADLRERMTILSGLSHPRVRAVHGHSNADQFLTGADTGARDDYKNSISLDQEFASHVGHQTRFSSLVMSTDGGTGTARGAHTLSFDRKGRAIPAAHKPKKIFDALFVTSDEDAARRLALDESALDDLLEDARALRRRLSGHDKASLDEYLDAVRTTELKVQKARHWVSTPLPTIERHDLQLEVGPEDSRNYLQAMFGLMFLALRTDSTRVVTYQIGRENSVGISDYLSRAIGFPLAHQLSHETKKPGGWKNFGLYCRFLCEELHRFLDQLRTTPEAGGDGKMLDNTLVLFGSASSAFHLSRNYPLILFGGDALGLRHGRYLNYAGENVFGGSWSGGTEPWQREFDYDDLPLSNLFVTMLQRLGVETDTFSDSTGSVDDL
ncbi:MAG: DUF1552 domain-containing protein [Planctomycetota bacterium]